MLAKASHPITLLVTLGHQDTYDNVVVMQHYRDNNSILGLMISLINLVFNPISEGAALRLSRSLRGMIAERVLCAKYTNFQRISTYCPTTGT